MNERILVVEDEAITALDLKYSLEEIGYEVIDTVDTGQDAIDIAEEKRPDVYRVMQDQYGYETENPGFNLDYDANNLQDGKHSLTINIISTTNNDIILSKTKEFYLKKVDGTICIDRLVQSSKKVAYSLSGWEMSTAEDSYIKTYIDGREIASNILRLERNDVINIIKNYGQKEVNEKPGFETYLDISNVGLGHHIVRIDLYSKYNELITSQEKDINIYSKEYISILINMTVDGAIYGMEFQNLVQEDVLQQLWPWHFLELKE